MSRVEWKPEYSVGNAAIDADHKMLFDLVNRLSSADVTDGFLSEIIAELEDYAAGHFEREEAVMRAADYPDLEEHIKGHRNFVEWLESVKITYRRAAESPFQIGDSVNAFLQGWLVNHILKEDMLYKPHIAKAR